MSENVSPVLQLLIDFVVGCISNVHANPGPDCQLQLKDNKQWPKSINLLEGLYLIFSKDKKRFLMLGCLLQTKIDSIGIGTLFDHYPKF